MVHFGLRRIMKIKKEKRIEIRRNGIQGNSNSGTGGLVYLFPKEKRQQYEYCILSPK